MKSFHFSFSFILNCSLTPFNNKPESSRALTIPIMSFISLFDVISVVVLDAKTCLCIPESAADAAAVYLKGIKTLLANALITLFINCNPIFSNGPRSLSRNLHKCT